MKKLLASALTTGVLALVGGASHGQVSFTFQIGGPGYSVYATPPGITSSPPGPPTYSTVFLPANAGAPFSLNTFGAGYTNVGYGFAQQTMIPPPPPNPAETFNFTSIPNDPNNADPATQPPNPNGTALVNFDLGLQGAAPGTFMPGTIQHLVVEGTIIGSMDFNTSTTSVTGLTIRDYTTGASSSATAVVLGNTYLVIPLTFNLPGQVVNANLFFLQNVLLSAPGNNAQNSIQGLIQGQAVPEPGSVALLVASGVISSVFAVRRRRVGEAAA